MRILYLTWDDVAKPTCGCAQRSAFLYEALRKVGDVDVVQLKHEWVQESFVAKIFRKLAKVARWPYGKPNIDLAALPLQLSIATKQYDAVVCRYLMTAAITQAWNIAPCYVDIDDLPIEAFTSVDGKRLPIVLRPLGAILVKWWQKTCFAKCAGGWAISEAQAKYLRDQSGGKVGVLPNLARRPNMRYNVVASQERLLMTVGLMGYEPNHEGVDWFLSNIWPCVYARWPDLQYAIAGGGAPDKFRKKWSDLPGVKVLGFVDDLDALYAKSFAVVTPILTGAGTCIKVVEAGLHGRVVLATPKALRGQESLLTLGGVKIFHSADQFCDILDELYSVNLTDLQKRIAANTIRTNSVAAFESSVMEVLTWQNV